jgi:enamine deaminase RidA (YjgF/YER057c/UK114 family)
MKKLFAMLFVASMVSFAACTSAETEETMEDIEATTEETMEDIEATVDSAAATMDSVAVEMN